MNKKYYGKEVSAKAIIDGRVEPPSTDRGLVRLHENLNELVFLCQEKAERKSSHGSISSSQVSSRPSTRSSYEKSGIICVYVCMHVCM